MNLFFKIIFRIGILCKILFSLDCQAPKSKFDLSSLFLTNLPISEIYFSFPGRNIPEEKKRIVRDVILSEIRKSKNSIRLYIYSMDDYEIITELYAKQRAGLNITIFGDKAEDYKELETLGFQVKRWVGSGIHHTKLILFDHTRLFVGTGNFTGHGLETDHNVYWIQNLSYKESESLVFALEGKNPLGRAKLGNLEYLFSPENGFEIQTQILEAIDDAKISIQYLMYSHYDPLITFKLLEAAKRGVRVQGIYNSPMSTNPEGDFLSKTMPYPSQIWEDGNVDFVFKNDSYRGGLLHHKTLLVDDKDVYVGSYNYSVSARDKNKEVFVKMSHPFVFNEFLMEWKRVQTNAIPLTHFDTSEADEPNQIFRQFRLQRLRNTLFETNFLFQNNGFLDSNSNGISKQYEQSLPFLIGANLEGSSYVSKRFHTVGTFSDPIWEESEVTNLSLSLSNYFVGTKVALSNGELVRSVSFWDGTSPKETIVLDSSSIALGWSDFRFGKNLWIWVHTDNRVISFCHTKEKWNFPKWMVFLLNRLETKQKQSLVCSND
ncbi:phospholipase D-like domain-containing protein [Leptospira sp. WS39.C2]